MEGAIVGNPIIMVVSISDSSRVSAVDLKEMDVLFSPRLNSPPMRPSSIGLAAKSARSSWAKSVFLKAVHSLVEKQEFWEQGVPGILSEEWSRAARRHLPAALHQ